MFRTYNARRVGAVWVIPGSPPPPREPNDFWKSVLFIVTAAVLFAIGATVYGPPG